jgi:hypothetical protein
MGDIGSAGVSDSSADAVFRVSADGAASGGKIRLKQLAGSGREADDGRDQQTGDGLQKYGLHPFSFPDENYGGVTGSGHSFIKNCFYGYFQ